MGDSLEAITEGDLMEAIKRMGPAEGWPELLGNVAVNLGVLPRAAPTPDLQKPDINLGSFARMLDFELSHIPVVIR